MIAGLKRIALHTADVSGAFAVARRVSPPWPRILMYHAFSGPGDVAGNATPVEIFRQHLRHVTRHYRPIRLNELARALAAGEPVPPRSVAITVDDGHASFLRWAFPLLEEFSVPATLFVVSDLPERAWLWTDKFSYICYAARRSIPSLTGAARAATIATLKHTSPHERERQLAEWAQQVGVTLPAQPPPPYTLLSWDELRQVVASPLIDIGSHTRTHPTLCSIDAEQAWDEVCESRRQLEQRLDVAVTAFCYPNGLENDYRPEHLTMVAKAGYECATAAHFGCVTSRSDRFMLPRIGGDALGMAGFRKVLDGFEYLRRLVSGQRCW